MDDVCTYTIMIRGQVDEAELNAQSPLCLIVEGAGPESSRITMRTDQSGLLGVLRHLHGLGIILLSIQGDYNASRN